MNPVPPGLPPEVPTDADDLEYTEPDEPEPVLDGDDEGGL